jgi:hypothetical protein
MTKNRIPLAIFLITIALSTGPAIAQSTCDQTRKDKTEADYQKCLRDEREQRSKQLIDIYKLQIESQKEKRTYFFDQRKRQAELLWKQADFDIEIQADTAEQRISLAKMSNADDPSIPRDQATIEALRQRQALQTRLKEQMLKVYEQREKMEHAYYDVQFVRYELSVRGLPVLTFDW